MCHDSANVICSVGRREVMRDGIMSVGDDQNGDIVSPVTASPVALATWAAPDRPMDGRVSPTRDQALAFVGT